MFPVLRRLRLDLAGFGNTGRNILRGPNQRNVDFAVAKSIAPEREDRWNREVRAEFFNALNFTNFSNPINSLSNPLAGAIVGTATAPRAIQFGFKVAF